ncbi:MAG: GntR family transcriptional regulator [Tepidiformaceae bacterium]
MILLDRASPMPLWAQMADDLRARIAAGEFSDRFPTDMDLVEQYGVSRHTVREALRQLGSTGVLERQRGRGTFLSPQPTLEQPMRGFYSLAESIEAQGLEEHSHVLVFETRTDAIAAGHLAMDAGAPLTYIERLRFAGEEPLAHDCSWLPEALGGTLDPGALTSGSLYEQLARSAGVRVTGGSERISAALPEASVRRLLKLPRSAAALRIERTAVAGAQPVEYRISTVRGDRYAFVADWGLVRG